MCLKMTKNLLSYLESIDLNRDLVSIKFKVAMEQRGFYLLNNSFRLKKQSPFLRACRLPDNVCLCEIYDCFTLHFLVRLIFFDTLSRDPLHCPRIFVCSILAAAFELSVQRVVTRKCFASQTQHFGASKFFFEAFRLSFCDFLFA